MPARDGFSIDTTPYSRDWTVEACLKHLEVAGYRQFGLTLRPGFLWPGDMDAEGCAHFRRFLAGHRLRIVSITAPDVDLISADPSVRDAAIDLLEDSTQLVDKLWSNAKYFKEEMAKLGFNTGASETPITPIMLGEAKLAQQFSREWF